MIDASATPFLRALRHLGGSLAGANRVEEVLELALEALCGALEIDRASILLFDDEGTMRFRAWRGLSEAYRQAVDGHSPWTADEEEPSPIVVADAAASSDLGPYRQAILDEGIGALAFVPLASRGRLLGKFMLYCDAPHEFSENELLAAETLASHIAFAIERLRAESELQRGESRWRLLAESGAALAGPLETGRVLDGFVQLVVPALADYALIFLVGADGQLATAAWSHRDPGRRELLERLAREFRPGPDTMVAAALAGGRAVLLPDVQERVAQVHADRHPIIEVTRELGARSALLLPLVARGRSLGVLALVFSESGRRYSGDDLPFAEELARRTALAVDNARLYARLRESDRRKDEFLAMLSHELRNPLATIVTALELLKRKQRDPEGQATAREMIERQTRHMTRMIDDLLDVARITQGKIRLVREPIDFGDLARHVVDGSRHDLTDAQRLTLTVAEPVWVAGDPARLQEVVANLVGNAIKFTPSGEIRVRVERAEDEAALVVEDEGVGIEAQALPSVFDLFVQGEVSLARSDSGLGIGLTLVRSLVDMHGGSVHGESRGRDQGSTFTVRLPLAAPAEPRQEAAASEPGDGNVRVLLVEDSVDTAQALSELMEIWGHEVATAGDGVRALEVLETFTPDVILLDIGLPGIDGYELARRIRSQDRFRETPLVALTGYGQATDLMRSAEGGFDHHLVKPVDLTHLQRLLGGF